MRIAIGGFMHESNTFAAQPTDLHRFREGSLTYGDTVIPFVFLARLNALAVIPFIAFFSVLSTGGDLAATESNLPTDFLLVLVALMCATPLTV